MKKSTKILLLIVGIFFILSLTGADCNIVKTVLGGKSGTELTKDDVERAINTVANILAGVSGTVAVIFVIIGGIQYIGSAGNQEQVGKAKQTITNAVIGIILITCSYVIVRWFTNFVATGTIGF